MKTVVCVLVALLVGMMLGSLPARNDLRLARNEVDDLKKRLASRRSTSDNLGGITSMLRLPDRSETGAEEPVAPHRHRSRTNLPPAVTSAATATPSNAVVSHARHGEPHTTNLNQAIETASALWKTRSELARQSFISNVAAQPDQTTAFDVAMAAMNVRLSNSVRTWVDYLKQERDLSPETGIRMMNDLSSSLVLAYDDLDRSMPEGWRTNAGPKFQVFDFINPDVAKPLTEVEGLFSPTNGPDAAWNGAGHDTGSESFTVRRTR